MGDNIDKKSMNAITSKFKIIEAAFKEKEFDASFCLATVL
jgi:hypothetical protein